MHLRPTRRFLAVAAALAALPYSLTAQEEPGRGGVFEFGAVLGTATFQDKSDIDGCTWVGVRVGESLADLTPGPVRDIKPSFRRANTA